MYIMCYKPLGADSLWTHVTHNANGLIQDLTIVAQPSFSPITAIAGMETPIAFVGTSGETDIKNGDFIVMQENNCANAHLVSTAGSSLAKTALSSGISVAHLTPVYDQALKTTTTMTRNATLTLTLMGRPSRPPRP